MYNDFLADPQHPFFASLPNKEALLTVPHDASLTDKALEKTFISLASESYKHSVEPGLACAKRCGNMYTGSLYAGIASLLSNCDDNALLRKRVALFAFGGGVAATFFALHIVGPTDGIARKLDLKARFAEMRLASCDEYSEAMKVSLVLGFIYLLLEKCCRILTL